MLPVAIVAYLIGSFPTAYMIGKHTRGVDISKSGTGNIGAMNAYEVTGSKTIGIAVGAVDMLKGLIVTLVAQYEFGTTAGLAGAFFAVLGHNYSIFMKFKGGPRTRNRSRCPVGHPTVGGCSLSRCLFLPESHQVETLSRKCVRDRCSVNTNFCQVQ